MNRILLISIIALGFNSCKYSCPEYPSEEVMWIPFENGDVVKYANGTDTIELTVIEVHRDEEYSERGLWMDLDCGTRENYKTNLISEIEMSEENRTTEYPGFSTKFSDSDFFEYALGHGFDNDSIVVRSIPDTTINGIQIERSFEVKKQSFGSRYTRFIKAPNRGIVLFEDALNNVIWTQIE